MIVQKGKGVGGRPVSNIESATICVLDVRSNGNIGLTARYGKASGDMIFGDRVTGITPEFSRILRSQILTKDRRWFVMIPTFDKASRSGTVPASWAEEPMMYPMGFGGQEQSPLTPMN